MDQLTKQVSARTTKQRLRSIVGRGLLMMGAIVVTGACASNPLPAAGEREIAASLADPVPTTVADAFDTADGENERDGLLIPPISTVVPDSTTAAEADEVLGEQADANPTDTDPTDTGAQDEPVATTEPEDDEPPSPAENDSPAQPDGDEQPDDDEEPEEPGPEPDVKVVNDWDGTRVSDVLAGPAEISFETDNLTGTGLVAIDIECGSLPPSAGAELSNGNGTVIATGKCDEEFMHMEFERPQGNQSFVVLFDHVIDSPLQFTMIWTPDVSVTAPAPTPDGGDAASPQAPDDGDSSENPRSLSLGTLNSANGVTDTLSSDGDRVDAYRISFDDQLIAIMGQVPIHISCTGENGEIVSFDIRTEGRSLDRVRCEASPEGTLGVGAKFVIDGPIESDIDIIAELQTAGYVTWSLGPGLN